MIQKRSRDGSNELIRQSIERLSNVISGVDDATGSSQDAAPHSDLILPSSNRELAQFIDHTLLKPEATAKEIEQLCQEALLYKFASVCVNPFRVELCAQILRGSGITVATVIGFPLGATTTQAKAFEAADAVK